MKSKKLETNSNLKLRLKLLNKYELLHILN